VLGLVFVLLVCFLRRGLIGGLVDLYGLAGRRRRCLTKSAPEECLTARSPAARAAKTMPSARRRARPRNRTFSGPILKARPDQALRRPLANSDIDFTVKAGELRGIIGPNGAGKSTFFKMLTCESRRPRARSSSRAATSPAWA
jgi:branched-chain amino acid transport system permease protein